MWTSSLLHRFSCSGSAESTGSYCLSSTREVIQQLRERELIPAEEGVSVLAHDDRFREVEKGCG